MKCKCGHDIMDHDKFTMECISSGCKCDFFSENIPVCRCGHWINFHNDACRFCSCRSFHLEDRMCQCGHTLNYHDEACHLCACSMFRLKTD